MAFQIKDFASIVASEINHARSATRKITDFQPGSVARTIMEAPAVEIEELYLQMFLGLREAIPVSTFLSFGFDQLPAAYATGYVSVSSATPLSANTVIPLGTEFTAADGRVYVSTQALTWLQGSTQITIPVAHTVAGLVGNIAAGAIDDASIFGLGYTVSNLPISNGRDVESFAEREARFAEYVQSLSRGTLVAVRYAARLASVLDGNGVATEYVTRIGIDEQAGRVYIYLYSNIGTASAALLADGQTRIDGKRDAVSGVTTGYRAAGVRVDVLSMVERAVPLVVSVEMRAGLTMTPAVIQSLGDIFSAQIRSVAPGDTLYLGTLVEAMLAAPGVLSIVPTGNSNFECGINEALVPGTFTATPL
jgi:hypothetical protein